MLSLLLASADGGTAWRQTLAAGEARAGWECVGPLGLARRVGRILGQPSDPAAMPDRVAAFAARLARHDDGRRSYSASRRADPFGVASFLLWLRDSLRLAGWSGGPLAGSARLEDLGAVEALDGPVVPPGFADLLDGLEAAVEKAGKLPDSLSIDLAAPREGFSPRVLRLLDALARAGAKVVEVPPDAALAPAGTDLGKLQRALRDPEVPRASLSGDGSFLLLEADTPIEAAELAAGVLRHWPLGDSTAVIAAGAGALDAALARQGLPTLGLSSSSRLRPHSQFLPLRLSLAFRPRDPFRAAELLLLPGAPLPGQVRRKLLGALNEMPGIGSPAWREAIEEAARDAEQLPQAGPEAGGSLRERIDDWFGGEGFDPRAGIPAAKAAALCGMVAEWAGARAGGAEKGADELDAGLWSNAAATARTLQRMLTALPPAEAISQLALAQLHDVAAGSGSDVAPFGAEAGRPAVCGAPRDVLPGSRAVLWFGFVQDAGLGPAPEPWTESEQAALAAAGVRVAAAGESRRFEAWGWRRPLLLARERVALVRWRLDGAEPVGPHPLADELRTRLAPGSLEACALGSERLLAGGGAAVALSTQELQPAAPIAPRPVWTVPPATLEPRGPLSATSIEALLGCPFRWALEQQAQLRPGRGVDLPADSRLLGGFAHRILQDMLLGDDGLDLAKAAPDEAAAWVLRAFDARVEVEAAPLVRPGNEVERDAARSLVGGAAAALVRHLQAGKWKPRAAEEAVTGTFAGLPVHGRVDLVLEKDGKLGLLDLKLSGGRYRREELEEGTGLQIALYASMLRRGRDLPPAGFLILSEGELLTVSPEAFPGATVVEGPQADETLRDAEESFGAWRKVLSKGVLPLCADDLPWAGPVAEAGGAALDEAGTPWREGACRFCQFTTLCRATVGEEGSP